MNYEGKRVLITGAAGVYGAGIVRNFAKEKALLCLSDLRVEKLKSLVTNEDLAGTDVKFHQTDLRSSQSIFSLVQLIKEEWGAPDVVINCAGIYPSASLFEMTREKWDTVMDINLNAPFEIIRELSQLMIQHHVKGTFINFSSASGYRPRLGAGHYAVSKAGINMLTRFCALELAKYNIRVNAVNPGFAAGSEVSPMSQHYIDYMVSGIPLGRMSSPDDVSQAIFFLCSEEASYITGTILNVDGGGSAGDFRLPEINE